MSWRDDVLRIIHREWNPGDSFSIDDMYSFHDELRQQHPLNRHIADKIRQQLQVLRDEGVLEFVDNHGTYRRST